MDPILFPFIVLGALAVLKKPAGSSSSSELYKPTPQGNFKKSLVEILPVVEETIKCPNLTNYLLTIGWIESRYYPSAITHEPGMGWYPDRFPKNKWRNEKRLWEYTGGLFQLFPYVALNTVDDRAKNLNPTAVFDPYYTIAFATDLIYRLHKFYDAETWLDVRLGWRSLRALKEKNPKEVDGVLGRLIKSTNENQIDASFLYEPVYFGNYAGYKGVLQIVEQFRKKT